MDSKGQNYLGYGNSQMQLKGTHIFIDNLRYNGNANRPSVVDFTISPKTRLHANIDKDNILINYQGSLESRSFRLRNVNIIRSKTNIQITGSIKVRGTSFSISITILEGDCVI